MKQRATFGGGCFWCTEAIFQQLEGITDVESGYSGGYKDDPSYKEVCYGETGHAEVIEVSYDDTIITFEEIVQIHLTTHNPTTLNKQGADKGTQYRSVIFYRNETEKKIIEQSIKKIQDTLDDPIVTEVKAFEKFYKAEVNHQDYYATNPNKPYCQLVIAPKLEKLEKSYKEKMK